MQVFPIGSKSSSAMALQQAKAKIQQPGVSVSSPSSSAMLSTALLSGEQAKALFAGNLRFSGAAAVSATTNKIPLNAILPWNDYMDLVKSNPKVVRNAQQRTLDMVLAPGVGKATVGGETIFTYNFFSNPASPENALFGMEKPIAQLMQSLRAAASGSSSASKLILLVGPVGTAKSTICTSLKEGLESYAQSDEGAMFALRFDLSDPSLAKLKEKDGPLYGCGNFLDSPMNEDPVSLLSKKEKQSLYDGLNQTLRKQAQEAGEHPNYALISRDTLSPAAKYVFDALKEHYGGDEQQVFEKHVQAKRLLPDEKAGRALGYLNAKEDKAYNEGMLVGNPNYRKVGQWGTASHPLAFAYDGVFNKGNRGITQLDEVIKYDPSMWNSMLSAAQERLLKPGENIPAVPYDGVIIATTNIPEWERKVKKNTNAEAFRDRISPISVPYNASLRNEMRIHRKIFEKACANAGMFPSRHTTHVAALLSILTRIAPPKNSSLTLIDKARLYDGQTVDKNITEQKIEQERKDAPQWELFKGLSPRTIGEVLDKAATLTDAVESRTVTPFQFIRAFEALLDDPQCTLLDEDKNRYREILGQTSEEVDRLYKLDVKRAIAGDKVRMQAEFDRYITHLGAWRKGEEVRNPHTARYEKVDETFMKSLEDECGVSDAIRKTFRDDLWSLKGDLGDKFSYDSDPKMRRGLENFLMKNSDLNVPPQMLNKGQTADAETRKKINTILQRLIDLPDEDGFGKYNEISAEVAMSRSSTPKAK